FRCFFDVGRGDAGAGTRGAADETFGGRERRSHRSRMSNCVVGSGGLRLPYGIIAEHSVEGCDHFSHDGDDDDLGFFVGVGEAIVEGFEGRTVSACAEGGHVEDITDRYPTTVDAAVSLELAAVEVIGRRSVCGSSSRVLATGR